MTKSASRTPQRLALKNDGPVVLASTGVDLGQVVAVDEFGNTVSTGIGDVSFASNGLGFIENGHYTAGSSAGTDTITITSGTGLQGTAQVHVVSGLSGLTVTRANSTTALSSLSLEPGDSVQLAASGTYWGRTAMRDLNSLTWTIEGDVGTITPEGLFTASDQSGAKGTIVAQVFHQTVRIPVTLSNAHSDVPPGHWAYDAVEFCYQQGIVSGVSDTEFGADHTIRRGDFMLMLYRAVGQPETKAATPFQDVSATDYYAKAVAWGHANGVISGISDTEFGPKNQITREQTFTILRRAHDGRGMPGRCAQRIGPVPGQGPAGKLGGAPCGYPGGTGDAGWQQAAAQGRFDTGGNGFAAVPGDDAHPPGAVRTV